jgi:starch phosphorylase
MTVKHANKVKVAELIKRTTGIVVDPHALFDVHIKRIHEYKRQLLNILGYVATPTFVPKTLTLAPASFTAI